MTPTKVDPANVWYELGEFAFDGSQRAFQRVAVLLTEGVKVEAVECGKFHRRKVRLS
jgi:hypothetical protein